MKDSYLNDEFFSRLEALAFNLRKDLGGFFGGKHLVSTYGQTVEFADYREYMLGDDILVAPVITKGALKRSVVFPKGKWLDSNGRAYEGPQTIEIDAPIEKLPYFIRDN